MDVSVIVCTYNPDKEIFQRCLDALSAQKTDGVEVEGFLIDNNSNPALETIDYVQEFLGANPHFRIVKETKPGLTFARMAGIRNAIGNICIFIDDDNEPANDYMIEAHKVGVKHPEIGAWGASRVNVIYNGDAPEWTYSLKKEFQQKDFDYVRSTDSKIRNRCYPVGTGMVMRRQLLLDYMDYMKANRTEVKDRTGDSLTSGGDLQMGLFATKNDYMVGIYPSLSLNHIIPLSRLNMRYMRKRIYGCAISYDVAQLGIYPEYREAIREKLPTNAQVIKTLAMFMLVNNFKLFRKKKQLELAEMLGLMNGIYQIEGKRYNLVVRGLVKLLNLE